MVKRAVCGPNRPLQPGCDRGAGSRELKVQSAGGVRAHQEARGVGSGHQGTRRLHQLVATCRCAAGSLVEAALCPCPKSTATPSSAAWRDGLEPVAAHGRLRERTWLYAQLADIEVSFITQHGKDDPRQAVGHSYGCHLSTPADRKSCESKGSVDERDAAHGGPPRTAWRAARPTLAG